jgi:hypothetical protein
MPRGSLSSASIIVDPPFGRVRRVRTGAARDDIAMEIPKDKIIDMLRERGADDKVQQAQQELPDQVDPERHADQLQKLGIDPQDLVGSIGDKLGL